MKIINVNHTVLQEMSKEAKACPVQVPCLVCERNVAGRLLNGEKDNFIYGIIKNHLRIICGIHEEVAYYTNEEMFCVCCDCQEELLTKVPEIMNVQHSPSLVNGGHFVTVFQVGESGEEECISRFHGKLERYKKIMSVLKN